MGSGKDRLYVVLYARGGAAKMPGLEDTYHWAFLVGPKVEPDRGGKATRFHVKESVVAGGQSSKTIWEYEERRVSLEPTLMILVRVLIGKVESFERLKSVFEKTPIRAGESGYDHWNCIEWLKEALEGLIRDRRALGSSVTEWETVRDTAMWYIAKKKDEHRFDGQGKYDQRKTATWDILNRKEIIS